MTTISVRSVSNVKQEILVYLSYALAEVKKEVEMEVKMAMVILLEEEDRPRPWAWAQEGYPLQR